MKRSGASVLISLLLAVVLLVAPALPLKGETPALGMESRRRYISRIKAPTRS